eukprot:302839-Rhodomonas_salina.1
MELHPAPCQGGPRRGGRARGVQVCFALSPARVYQCSEGLNCDGGRRSGGATFSAVLDGVG